MFSTVCACGLETSVLGKWVTVKLNPPLSSPHTRRPTPCLSFFWDRLARAECWCVSFDNLHNWNWLSVGGGGYSGYSGCAHQSVVVTRLGVQCPPLVAGVVGRLALLKPPCPSASRDPSPSPASLGPPGAAISDGRATTSLVTLANSIVNSIVNRTVNPIIDNNINGLVNNVVNSVVNCSVKDRNILVVAVSLSSSSCRTSSECCPQNDGVNRNCLTSLTSTTVLTAFTQQRDCDVQTLNVTFDTKTLEQLYSCGTLSVCL